MWSLGGQAEVQGRQAVALDIVLKFSFGHVSHTLEPELTASFPGTHCTHTLAPLLEKDPGTHNIFVLLPVQ
jgi:hypothetical protein